MQNPAIPYSEILSGPGRMICDHYHANISKKTCVQYQTKAKKLAASERILYRLGIVNVTHDRGMSCLNCDQGKGVLKEWKGEGNQPDKGICKRHGCKRPAKTRGFCTKHYQQVNRRERKGGKNVQ